MLNCFHCAKGKTYVQTVNMHKLESEQKGGKR